jgi:hypothetical protein
LALRELSRSVSTNSASSLAAAGLNVHLVAVNAALAQLDEPVNEPGDKCLLDYQELITVSAKTMSRLGQVATF